LRAFAKGGGFFLFMPRRLKRYTGRGELHFITFSCYERRAFLHSKRAKNLFVKVLGETRVRFGFRLIGYVLMPEHVHLLIDESPKATPAKIIQVLKQRVSRAMRGKRRGARGQLPLPFPGDLAERRRFWQRRYYDFNVYRKEKLREKLNYMHANPVKRRLVVHPRDWPWSSWTFYELGEGLLAMDRWE
jgi:putative transposase